MRKYLDKILCLIFGCKYDERIVLNLTKTDWDVSFLLYKKCNKCGKIKKYYKRQHIEKMYTAIYGDMLIGKDWRVIILDVETVLLDTKDPNKFKKEMQKMVETLYGQN